MKDKLEIKIIKSNNCPECMGRIFLTSSGLADCGNEKCENYCRPIAYITKEMYLDG